MRHDLARHAAELAGAPADLGKHGARDVEQMQQLFFPLERMDVKQHGAAGVRVIRRVHRAAGQVVDEQVSMVPNMSSPASAAARAPSTFSKIHLILVAEKYADRKSVV